MTKYTGEGTDFLDCVTSGKGNEGQGTRNKERKDNEEKKREAERNRRKLKI